MIKIDLLTFNPFRENTYIVSEPGGQCVIIDAGNYSEEENESIGDFIRGKGLSLVMAVNTHGHIDHMLGVNFVKSAFGIPFALDFRDKYLIDGAEQYGAVYGFEIGSAPSLEIDLGGMDHISLGNQRLRLIHTPGHTPGHVCIYHEESKVLFSGDTLFRESIGRTDLPGGDYDHIMRSIIEKIIPLGGDVVFYPGHGPESTIGHEVLYNPFITEVLGGEIGYEP